MNTNGCAMVTAYRGRAVVFNLFVVTVPFKEVVNSANPLVYFKVFESRHLSEKVSPIPSIYEYIKF